MPARLLGVRLPRIQNQVTNRPTKSAHQTLSDIVSLDFLLPWAINPTSRRQHSAAAARTADTQWEDNDAQPEAGPSTPRRLRSLRRTRETPVEKKDQMREVRTDLGEKVTFAPTVKPLPLPSIPTLRQPQRQPSRRRRPKLDHPNPRHLFTPQSHQPPFKRLYDASSPPPIPPPIPPHNPLLRKLLSPRIPPDRPKARSFVHKQLSRNTLPPDPGILHAYLQTNPSWATTPAAVTLKRYANRTGHFRVATDMRKLISRLDRRAWVSDTKAKETISPTRGIVFSSLARRQWPPRESGNENDFHSTMCAIHWQLATANTGDSTEIELENLVNRVKEACSAEGRGELGTNEALLELFKLYITYSSVLPSKPTGMRIIQEFRRVCPDMRPSRQILKALTCEILWPMSYNIARLKSIYNHLLSNARDLEYDAEKYATVEEFLEDKFGIRNLVRYANRPSLSTTPPNTTVTNILIEVLNYFVETWEMYPSCSTCRMIFYYALRTDHVELGKMAYDGWWYAYATNTCVRPSEGDTPRFRRRGTERLRWRHIIRWQRSSKRWVGRVQEGTERRGWGGTWGWKGRATSEGAEDGKREAETEQS